MSFKVGDILIGKRGNGYPYTNHTRRVRVTAVDGLMLTVVLLKAVKGISSSIGPWYVEASKFNKVRRAKTFRLPRWVTALVVEAGVSQKISNGDIVTVDLHSIQYDGVNSYIDTRDNGESYVVDRFAIDPILVTGGK